MAFYRFITENELDRIRQQQALLAQGHYPPYKKNEVIFVFESNNLLALFTRYGTALANHREMQMEAVLIAIEVFGFAGQIEKDKSQNGWDESRAIFGTIPIVHLRVVAQAVVEEVRGEEVKLGPLQDDPKILLRL